MRILQRCVICRVISPSVCKFRSCKRLVYIMKSGSLLNLWKGYFITSLFKSAQNEICPDVKYTRLGPIILGQSTILKPLFLWQKILLYVLFTNAIFLYWLFCAWKKNYGYYYVQFARPAPCRLSSQQRSPGLGPAHSTSSSHYFI